MSERSLAVWQFIQSHRNEKGISPTYREIGKACSIPTTSAVRYTLDILERESIIRRHAGVARGIVLLKEFESA